MDPKKPHKCCHVTCTNCGEFKHVDHRCFIQPVVKKDQIEEEFEASPDAEFAENDEEDEEKKGPPPPPLLVFANIECYLTEERVFVPNLICWPSEDDTIYHADTIKEFLLAIEDLTEVEGDERERKVISYFHNMRGFDGNFILEALYDQGRVIERPLTQGAKILYFECGNLFLRTP